MTVTPLPVSPDPVPDVTRILRAALAAARAGQIADIVIVATSPTDGDHESPWMYWETGAEPDTVLIGALTVVRDAVSARLREAMEDGA